MGRKHPYMGLLLLLALVLAIHLVGFKNGHNWGDDFASYIEQARAIAEWNFDKLVTVNKYRVENSPGVFPGTYMSAWGFPLLLSPVYYLFGLDIQVMKIYVALFFIGSLAVLFLLFRERLKAAECLLVLAVIAFNPKFYLFKEFVNSDTPFIFFSFLTLLLIDRTVIMRKPWVSRGFSYSVLGALIFLSIEIRSIGYVLLPTLLYVQYVENRGSVKKAIIDLSHYAPYVVFVVLSVAKKLLLPPSSIYEYFSAGRSLEAIMERAVFHIKYYLLLPMKFLASTDPITLINYSSHWQVVLLGKLFVMLYCVLLLFVFWGIVITRKRDYIFSVYVLLALLVLMIYPTEQGYRYILPFFPFFIYFLFAGLSQLSLTLSIRDRVRQFSVNVGVMSAAAFLAVCLFITANMAYKDYIFNKTEVIEGPYTADSVKMFDFIKTNTDKDSIISYMKPRAMALYTDRRSIRTNNMEILLGSTADYYVHNKKIHWWYEYDLAEYMDQLSCVYENDTFVICKL